jgi:hypothetical protein
MEAIIDTQGNPLRIMHEIGMVMVVVQQEPSSSYLLTKKVADGCSRWMDAIPLRERGMLHRPLRIYRI